VVFNSEEKQGELSRNMKALALPNATKDICDEVEKLIKI
jgi:UDP-N-acetylglucosamine--N-acetylmuramyl-(pentapeptide) pyrophosphoryl-undecaprenol N-acetylglucosamine transferase